MVQLSQITEQTSRLELSLAKHFKWWATIIVLLVVIIMIWYLVWPKFVEWRTMTQARDLQAQLFQRQEKFSQLQGQIKQWQKMKSQLGDDLQLVLPAVEDAPNLLVQIETLAARSKLPLRSLSISSATGASKRIETSSGVKQVRLLLNLQGGDYKSLKSFLGELQTAWRLLQVENINYSSQGFSLEVTGYYYPH